MMVFEDPKNMLPFLFEKQRLLRAGDPRHKEIRPALVGLPGLMLGTYGAGQGLALEKFGLMDCFDFVVASSTGLAQTLYSVASQSATALKIYLTYLANPEIMKRNGLKLDADRLAHVFRGEEGDCALIQPRIIHSRSKIYAGVTNAVTGKGEFLNVKRLGWDGNGNKYDIVQAIRASIAIPRSTGPAVQIGNNLYLDGIGGCPFMVPEVFATFEPTDKPTDILVLANSPEPDSPSFDSVTDLGRLCKGYPQAVRDAFTHSKELFRKGLEWARSENCPCRVSILWADGKISAAEQDTSKLLAAAQTAEDHLESLLAAASPAS